MLKKINILIVFLALSCSLNLNIGVCLIAPILLFYLLKDFKNIYYSYFAIILICFLFYKNYLILMSLFLVLLLSFYFLITKVLVNCKTFLIDIIISLFLTLSNVIICLFFQKQTYLVVTVTSIISVLIYLYLEKYLYKIILGKTEKIEDVLSTSSYLEILIALCAVFSASSINLFNVNFGVLIGGYFAIYFSKTYKNIYSIVYGCFAFAFLFLGFNIYEAIFILFLSAIYITSNTYVFALFNLFLAILIFKSNIYNKLTLICLMIISILYEITLLFFVEEKRSDNEIFEAVHLEIQKNMNDELLNYALFLDKFQEKFKISKERATKIDEGIKTLIESHCKTCQKKTECFKKYRGTLYSIFKEILLQENIKNKEYDEFRKDCIKTNHIECSIKKIESYIKTKEDIESLQYNKLMIAQINQISNIIKNYVVDVCSFSKINYYQILMLKEKVKSYGYNIVYFEIIKLFKQDFNIKLGISFKKFEEISSTIKLLTENILNVGVSVILEEETKKLVTLNIVPKMNIDITYGYGSLAFDGEDICGDNYLIKELSTGRFISVISDGMGKGYRAFCESKTTLNLIDEIISLNISTSTALEILNSFYSIQEYLEEYATLDFLEINRHKEIATFYKMGAASTYIFKANNEIIKITNENLPFGLDKIESREEKLDDGDLILMSSDGIFENILDEDKLKEFINSLKKLPPQKIVYELLNFTLKNKIQTKDDMSIIALKIEKK